MKSKVLFFVLGAALLFGASTLKAQDEVKDYDGNSYKTVKIGSQVWMAENLKTTHYRDGAEIPNVTDRSKWAAATTPGYCWYDNDKGNKDEYGALYNWYVVGTGKLCPKGWHVPTDAEWKTLESKLGGAEEAATKLKEKGDTHWKKADENATDEYGFAAVGAGFRNSDGDFTYKLSDACWWTATPGTLRYACNRVFSYYSQGISRRDIQKTNGYSIRCVKD